MKYCALLPLTEMGTCSKADVTSLPLFGCERREPSTEVARNHPKFFFCLTIRSIVARIQEVYTFCTSFTFCYSSSRTSKAVHCLCFYLAVGGVLDDASHVAAFHAFDAHHALVNCLNTPEATCKQHAGNTITEIAQRLQRGCRRKQREVTTTVKRSCSPHYGVVLYMKMCCLPPCTGCFS